MDDSEPNHVSKEANESQMRHKVWVLLYQVNWDFRKDNKWLYFSSPILFSSPAHLSYVANNNLHI